MGVTSTATSVLILSLAAKVFLCLDDGLDFLFDSGCEFEVFLQARGRDALSFSTTSLFFGPPILRGPFGLICPECTIGAADAALPTIITIILSWF